MVKRIVSLTLFVSCCLISAVFAAEPNDYLVPGKSDICEGSLSSLREAYQIFDAGLNDTSCADCNTNRELIFLHAATRTAMLFIDNNDLSINDSFLEVAERFGVQVLGDFFEELDVNVSLTDNRYKIPDGAPDSNEISTIVHNWIAEINDVNGIVAELNSISDSPSDRFRFFFEPNDTGLENPLEVDYGEVLILKGLLLAFKSQLEAKLAYDVFVDVNETLLHELLYEDGVNPEEPNFAELAAIIGISDPNNISINDDFLNPYPDLLKVLPTSNFPDVNGKAILAQVRQDWIDSINYYFDALNYIVAEDVPPGTDPQEDEFLYIDPDSQFVLDVVEDRLTALRDSLQNDTIITYPLETTKTYDIYDANSVHIGQLALVYNFTGIEGDDGSLTFVDTNLAPSPWEVEWFGREDANQIEVELEYYSESGWKQGWLEGTLSNDGNSIIDATFEYWGSAPPCTATFYEVWAGNTDYTAYPQWWGEYFFNIDQQDYTKMGESDGQTKTFFGDYAFYVIAARHEFFLDSIQGSTGAYYNYGSIWTGNTSNEQNIWGPTDGWYATVGYQESWTAFRGFVAIANPGDWTSITVTSDRICSPGDTLYGLSGLLISTEVEEVNINPNPIFGSSPNYPNPVNPRDLLPLFDQENIPITCTFGHGLGNDATLGGILPDMTQQDWATSFDLGFLQGDSDTDCDVDFTDYAVLAIHWLNQNCTETDWCDKADIDQSGEVDIFDLYIFADNWLEGAGG
ncbi:MAG: hypothetical protein PHY02_04805 [Phycisphaerae bacterium]|nr:hypothetical protein [Phycisphaerae bacterium]